jgi:hypothetical protein
MRTALIAAVALLTGFILSAAADQAKTDSVGCNSATKADHAAEGISQGGFTQVRPITSALIVRAVDPDGNPVTMIVTPASNQ